MSDTAGLFVLIGLMFVGCSIESLGRDIRSLQGSHCAPAVK